VTRVRVQRWGHEAHQRERDVLQRAQQALAALKEIRVLGRERWFWDRFVGAQESLAHARHRHNVLVTVPRVLIEAVFALGAFGLVALVVLLGSGGDRIVPLLALYAYAGFRMIPSANRLMMYANEIRAGAAPVAAVHADLAAAPAAATSPPEPEPPLAFREAIVCEDVSFRWADGAAAGLDGVRLVVRRGEAVGIVGATGSGKSTLVDVLIGLLPPSAGRVLVDGADVAPRRRAWQQAIGYVPQVIVLVDDTLRRNVALGIPDAQVDEAALRDALRLAQLDAFVATLPEGLATRVGERGVRLSGGERQRVGIARALYHRPDVLVFDEATSALDNRTEADLLAALGGNARTLVMVAHRLSSVRGCDRLVLLAGGRIVAAGTWDELQRESDAFRRLVAAEPAA
jgi:ATP-binding cassette subfamily C protein